VRARIEREHKKRDAGGDCHRPAEAEKNERGSVHTAPENMR
jgi:hypothetical protein